MNRCQTTGYNHTGNKEDSDAIDRKDKSMSILFVNCEFRLFDGIDCGAGNRSTMFVRSLSKVGHVDVLSFYKEPLVSNVPNCDVVQNSKTLQAKHKRWEYWYANFRLLITPMSPYAYYLFDKPCAEQVDIQLKKKKYDIVACRYVKDAVMCGLLKYADRLVIDVDDNLRSASLRDIKNTTFKHFHSKWLSLYRANSIQKMGERFLAKTKVSFYSNSLEPTSAESVYLHNVTTTSSKCSDISAGTPPRLLFVGWLDFRPNRLGILHFADSVFPNIKKVHPEAELHVVGKTNDQSLKEHLNSIDGVKAMGFVEDLSEEYENCRVVILPVYYGAGTCVKFVEGLMMNRPIVSTPMGARGYERTCRDGEQYLLANTDEEFADKVNVLLSNTALAREIAANAYKVGMENYSAECFENIVVNNIKKVFHD